MITISFVRENFSENLKNFREKRNFSQEELSRRCGYDRTYIGKIERGRKDPSLETIIRIAESLNVPVRFLFGEPHPPIDGNSWEFSQEFLEKTSFQYTSRLILVTDPRGIILHLNKAVIEFSGHESKDLLGNPFLNANLWARSAVGDTELKRAFSDARSGKEYENGFQVETHTDGKSNIHLTINPVSTNSTGPIDFVFVEICVITKPDEEQYFKQLSD